MRTGPSASARIRNICVPFAATRLTTVPFLIASVSGTAGMSSAWERVGQDAEGDEDGNEPACLCMKTSGSVDAASVARRRFLKDFAAQPASPETRAAKRARSTLPPLMMTPTRSPHVRNRAVQRCGGGKAACRLDDNLHPFGEEAHRLDKLRVRHAVTMSATSAADDRECQHADMRRRRAVGERARRRDAHDLAVTQRLLRVVAGFRLDADHLAAGRERLGGERAAGEQPAAARADEKRVERPNVFEQFLRGRALAGDDVGMIVRAG